MLCRGKRTDATTADQQNGHGKGSSGSSARGSTAEDGWSTAQACAYSPLCKQVLRWSGGSSSQPNSRVQKEAAFLKIPGAA